MAVVAVGDKLAFIKASEQKWWLGELAFKFMVIIPLLVIELKTTCNGSPTNDFYWREKSSSLSGVQCYTTS